MWQQAVTGALVALAAVYAVKVFAPRWFARHVGRRTRHGAAAQGQGEGCGCGEQACAPRRVRGGRGS